MAGCGGGGSSSATGSEATPATTPTSTTAATGDATPDDVYQACIGALEGKVSEQISTNACTQVRDAFQQCATAASNTPEGSAKEQALQACQEAANKATTQLEASP